MRLSSREWILFVTALGAVCLLVFLAVSAASSSGGSQNKAAPMPTVSVREKEQEEFSLTVDERGLRSDWRSPEENGSLRVDVSSEGLNIRTHGTSTADITASSKRCTCACEH